MGRVVTIIYAIVGIPLTLLTLTNLGSFMATAFRFLYRNVCCGFCCLCCRKPDIPHVSSATVKYRDDENGDPGASKSLTGDQQDEVYCLEHQPSKPKTYSIRVYWRAGIRRLMQTEDNETVTVPIYISLLLIAGYIAIGALLFTLWEEDWDYLIGSYFCFITLTTIGFGDYVPGTSLQSWAQQEKLVFCAMYLLFGLALIAMCFDLMQAEARNKVRTLGKMLGFIDKKKWFQQWRGVNPMSFECLTSVVDGGLTFKRHWVSRKANTGKYDLIHRLVKVISADQCTI